MRGPRFISLIAALSTLLIAHSAQPQGSLSPPGAPAPTMRTLEQVEPRTPISTNTTPGDADALFKITQPGSYYLTTNITGVAAKHGIEIAASGVTLDLNGFELLGATVSLDGVSVTIAATNIAVRNGSVRGWGGDGVDTANAGNCQVSQVVASRNSGNGLICGQHALVVQCTSLTNGLNGIRVGRASVVHTSLANYNAASGIVCADPACVGGGCQDGASVVACTASLNGETGINIGIGSTAQACSAIGNGGRGLFSECCSTFANCTAKTNRGNGIDAGSASLVVNCALHENYADGIKITEQSYALNNMCDNNGNPFGASGDGAGIHGLRDNRIEGNCVTENDRGIDLDLTNNLVIRNSARNNGDDYGAIVAGNKVGEILDFSAAGSVTITNSNPCANFRY